LCGDNGLTLPVAVAAVAGAGAVYIMTTEAEAAALGGVIVHGSFYEKSVMKRKRVSLVLIVRTECCNNSQN